MAPRAAHEGLPHCGSARQKLALQDRSGDGTVRGAHRAAIVDRDDVRPGSDDAVCGACAAAERHRRRSDLSLDGTADGMCGRALRPLSVPRAFCVQGRAGVFVSHNQGTFRNIRYMKPRVAVFKFASCDGCQLQFLNAEDELLKLAGQVDFVYFPEARSRVREGPYDIAFVEGSITTPEDARRIIEV